MDYVRGCIRRVKPKMGFVCMKDGATMKRCNVDECTNQKALTGVDTVPKSSYAQWEGETNRHKMVKCGISHGEKCVPKKEVCCES